MLNEFIIKINKNNKGENISLENITIDAAEALNLFIDSLSKFAKAHENYSDISMKISNGSVETGLVYPDTVADEINDIIDGTSENMVLVKHFRKIQDTIKANGLDYTVLKKRNNRTKDVTKVFKGDNFIIKRGARSGWYEKIVFLNGKLFNAGGQVSTNIHIESGEDIFKIECSREEAKKVNTLLYENVFLSVKKRWKTDKNPEYLLVDYYSSEDTFKKYNLFFERINDDQNQSKYDDVHAFIDKIYSKGERITEVIKLMKLYNFPFSNRGVQRTILMTLKPVKGNNDKVLAMYNQLLATFNDGRTNNSIK